MRSFLILNALCLLASSGMAQPAPTKAAPVQQTSQEQHNELERVVLGGWGKFSMGDTPKRVIDVLGKPKRHSVSKEQSVHDPAQTNERHKISYDGMEIEILVAGENVIWQEVVISNNRYLGADRLKVGAAVEDVKKWFGVPKEVKGEVLQYVSGDPTESFLFIKSRKGVVTEIHWSFYVD